MNVGGFSRSALGRKLLLAAAVLLVLWGSAAVARAYLGVDLEPRSLRDFVTGLGAIGPVVFVLLVTFRMPLGMPSQLLLVAGGLGFGTLAGTAYGALGITASGLALFFLSRWMGREFVDAHVPGRLRPVFLDAGGPGGAVLVALGTAYPIGPITAYHALAGVTGMKLLHFGGALLFGATIRSLLFTFFGSSLVAQGPRPLVFAGVLIACVGVAPMLFPASRRWVLQLAAPASFRQAAAEEPRPPEG